MFQSFLIKYGEIGVKGKNRHVFEEALMRRIQDVLKPVDGEFAVSKEQGRIYVHAPGSFDYDAAVAALTCVFGIVGFCPMYQTEPVDFEQLTADVLDYWKQTYGDRELSFKVESRRADKSFPVHSQEMNASLGEKILDVYPHTHVDVHDPEVLLHVEVRGKVNIYSQEIEGPGGMPAGTAGRAMLLLSGGIDSPVAGYMTARRGVELSAVYFHAPPYTSERAKQKVIDLAGIIARYSGPIRLHIVNFTDIQLYIYDQCPHDELTILMRRYMMRIAEDYARADGCLGLVTGESIGQVASQTMQSLAATNDVCTMPVYRPLIAFDKNDIVRIAEKIGTYETSILPYEDCCTIFVAKHPVTKPNVHVIRNSERRLSEKIDELYKKAIESAETIVVHA